MSELIRNDVERFAMHKFVENAYLNYSMYVIMDRALPYIGDGLKPVQRRIIYAMSELGVNANAKFKKSARTIGDVLGKYHPHGDTACYEAMVLMAQPFSYRYPLVEGQGNWGSPDDPKSYAAMRYTESRLSKYSEILLNELDQATVDYIPNFDGTLQEPKTLPARLPNILLNGATGIAVGMATDIPPHNLYEVTKATIKLLDNPKTTLGELLNIIHGPDFPTKAEIITTRNEILKIYQNGRGSIRQRAIWKKEDGKAVITAIPYQVSNARILEQITLQMRNKKLSRIKYLRDESDHENLTRLVIVPYNNSIDLEQLMHHLFITTDLEKSYRVNFNMIGLDNRPSVKNLLNILSEWLVFRRDTIRRRLKHDLDCVLNRLYILEGLLIAFLNIKEVIYIISNEDEPNSILISRFNICTIQAKAILELKLRQIAKLEGIRIVNERTSLEKERTRIQSILSSERKINNLIRKELLYDSQTYGNVRCSPIYECEKSKLLNENNLVISEPVTIILSQMGWVRSINGHNNNPMHLKYKAGDSYLTSVHGRNNQLVAFIDSIGRSYTLDSTSLSSEHIYGEPLTSKLLLPPGVVIEQILMEEKNQNLLIASDAGYGFICTFSDLKSRKCSGKSFIRLPKNSKIMMIIAVQSRDNMILAITQASRMLIFPVADLPHMSKGKGNKIISISSEKLAKGTDKLKWLLPLSQSSSIIFHIGKRKIFMHEKELKKICAARGQQGHMLSGLEHIDQVELLV